MIYIGRVIPGIMDSYFEMSVMEFFSSYKPQQIKDKEIFSDLAKMDYLKKKRVKGFISGEMSAMIRNNKNLLSRDCLVLDLDDVTVTEDEFVKWIGSRFSEFSYVAYPSISNGVKGIRYRLVLPLSDNVTDPEDYKILVSFFLGHICQEVNGTPDESNRTWSQLMGLPVITPFNSTESILVHQGKLLPLAELLNGAKKWHNEQELSRSHAFSGSSARYRNKTTELFESLVAGCGEGGRNNRIAQITGGLLRRSVDVRVAAELVEFANSHFNPPLEQNELEAVFKSIATKELS